MKITIIYNPIAGRRNPGSLAKAVRAFGAQGIDPDLRKTEGPGDAYGIACETAQEGADAVIAAGGDGTINEIANALVGSRAKLGVLPLGGANVFALEMQIPADPAAAVNVIVNGTAQRLSPGYIELPEKVNGKTRRHYFLLMAGIGFDGGVLRDIRRSDIARWGKLAYVMTGARCIVKYTHSRFTIRVDGSETLVASSAVVGKSRYYGGKFMVTPRATLKDESLDLCAFMRQGSIPMVQYACSVLRGGHLRHQGIYYAKAKDLEMSSSEEVFVQTDGDFLGTLPARLGVEKGALSVILPGRRAPS